MKRKMLVLDIDGTLTNSQKEVTPATRAALDAIRREGHLVVVASGRPKGGMISLLADLEYEKYGGYYISYNGACVTDAATDEDVVKRPIPMETIKWMQRYALENGLAMCVHRGTEMLAGTKPDKWLDYEAYWCHFTQTIVEDFDAYRDVDFFKVLMSADAEIAVPRTKELAAMFGDTLNICQSEPFFVEVMSPGVDKGVAVEALARQLGIPREDVIACGDGMNDMGMIVYAGVGVAMGNARDEVKAAADYVTTSNDEDGLVPVIEKFIMHQD